MSLSLNFHDETGDFEGITTYSDKQYKMTLVDFNTKDIENATVLGTQVHNWLSKNLDDVKRFTTSALIKLKNDSWLDENEPPVSEESFMKTIELDSVLVFSEGSFDIYFNDNDLFRGHSIKVDIDQYFNVRSADLWG
jgi:hypothetical protein